MAGIYIHIPFCSQACTYCDFHFSTSLKRKEEMFKGLMREIDLRQDYLSEKDINTIYFGGGTPSILSPKEGSLLINKIHKNFNVAEDVEVTLEANPENLIRPYLQDIYKAGINRLSIGIQSFIERDLKLMNRIHSSQEAEQAIKLSQDVGIENISIDLIYAVPGQKATDWNNNIAKALSFEVPHISSYCLTVEEGTVLHHQIQKGIIKQVKDEKAIEDFELLIDQLDDADYLHYEISNFARPGYISRHNSAYWKGAPYLGIGPSAHSYTPGSRQWNVANNISYLSSIRKGEMLFEQEKIDLSTAYNEYVLTSLRTMWGCDMEEVKAKFGDSYFTHLEQEAAPYLARQEVALFENKLLLTRKGKFIADKIAGDLFF